MAFTSCNVCHDYIAPLETYRLCPYCAYHVCEQHWDGKCEVCRERHATLRSQGITLLGMEKES